MEKQNYQNTDNEDFNNIFQVELRELWRIGVTIAIFFTIAILLVNRYFPNTLVFFKLWCGFAIGAIPGLMTGYAWHTRDPARRSQKLEVMVTLTGGIWAAIAFIGLITIIPMMSNDEAAMNRMKSLNSGDFVAVQVETPVHQTDWIDDPDLIKNLAAMFKKAELVFPSHELSLQEYVLRIKTKQDAIMEYRARVPESDKSSIYLKSNTKLGVGELQLAGGHWLIESIVDKDKSKSVQK